MRLLRLSSSEDRDFDFVEYQGDDIPPYAILSHTWSTNSADEVTFKELKKGLGKEKPGYEKIRKCGEIAAQDGIEYFWVDTCCIDKSSSAELTEAINSMYRWYQKSKVCYAYLSDVESGSSSGESLDTGNFGRSRWFTRGWTLQELIAPAIIRFFSMTWRQLGTKESLADEIEAITDIPLWDLDSTDLATVSVARRMSWAANRTTTRVEDMAYSLMGIFDVNMPLLYGEREKAFLRLQEQIMKNSTDHSLFAWRSQLREHEACGLLALSPSQFEFSGNIRSMWSLGRSAELSFTGNGVRTELFLIKLSKYEDVYIASLDCRVGDTASPVIYLRQIHDGIAGPSKHLLRIWASTSLSVTPQEKVGGSYQLVFVSQNYRVRYVTPDLSLDCGAYFRIRAHRSLSPVRHFGLYDPQFELLFCSGQHGKLGGLLFKKDDLHYLVVLGIDSKGSGWCCVQLEEVKSDSGWEAYKSTGKETSKAQAEVGTMLSLQVTMQKPAWVHQHYVVDISLVSELDPKSSTDAVGGLNPEAEVAPI